VNLCEGRSMNDRPAQPPEGRLIAEAAERLGLSIREASRRAGISYGRWRQIVTGQQHVSQGVVAPVRNAPAKTVARMARVVGVTPGDLEKAGRGDAADELRKSEAGKQETFTPSPAPELGDEVRIPAYLAAQMNDTALRSVVPQILARAREVLDRNPSATGSDIFPEWPKVAHVWDLGEPLSLYERAVYAATARLVELREEWQQRRSG
jgi:hypothetical protein